MENNSRAIMNQFKRNTRGVNEKLDMDDDLVDEADLEIIPDECSFDRVNPDNDVAEDYEYIRKKLRWSIAACEKVFEMALRDLVANPSPRVVEGCSTIMKTVTECTSQLFTLHGSYRKIPRREEPEETDEEGGGKKPALKATVNDIIDALDEREADGEGQG